MSGRDDIRLEAVVVEAISDHAWKARLANGHEFVAHATLKKKTEFARLKPGDEITVSVTPFDFSKGRIEASRQTN